MNMEIYQAVSTARREGNTAWQPTEVRGRSPTYVSKPNPAISSVAAIPSSRNGGEGGLAGPVQGLEMLSTGRKGQQRGQLKDTDPLETAGTVASPLAISDVTGEQKITSVMYPSTVTTWEVTAHPLSSGLHSS